MTLPLDGRYIGTTPRAQRGRRYEETHVDLLKQLRRDDIERAETKLQRKAQDSNRHHQQGGTQ